MRKLSVVVVLVAALGCAPSSGLGGPGLWRRAFASVGVVALCPEDSIAIEARLDEDGRVTEPRLVCLAQDAVSACPEGQTPVGALVSLDGDVEIDCAPAAPEEE